jgi:DNA-binding sugar fermentation-stimulating protein
MDAHVFQPAAVIDAQYAKALSSAIESGVEAMAYDAHIDTQGIALHHRLPLEI